MDQDRIAEFPASCWETLHSALRATFGSIKTDRIMPISGGVSGAFPFRVEIGDRRYVIRMEGPARPLRNPHQYDSMLIAAEAGISPKVHYIDRSSRVVVMDYIDARPLRSFPGGSRGLVRALGQLLRRLQATPPFQQFVAYPDIVDRLWQWVCQTGLFAPGLLDPYTERLAHIRETYIWEPVNLVSSHSDPVPLNILFDGNRLWLIDWENAYRNDPLVDVAIVLDNLAPSPELESILLRVWLGRDLDDELRARLAQVRALSRLSMLVFCSAVPPQPPALGRRRSFGDDHCGISTRYPRWAAAIICAADRACSGQNVSHLIFHRHRSASALARRLVNR